MFRRKPKAVMIFTQDGEEIDIKLKFRPKNHDGGEAPTPISACLIAYHLFCKEMDTFVNGNTHEGLVDGDSE